MFIDVEDPEPFPPQQRHPGSQLEPSTDGNQVELLVEGAIDKRFPGVVGGHHQKFNVTRGVDGLWTGLVSSADFFFARWDTTDHQPDNPNRSSKGGPTHAH